MSLSVSTPISGSHQTGFTSPSFAVSQDNAVQVNARRWIVTSTTGAGGVAGHTVSNPFMVQVSRPAVFKPAPTYLGPIGPGGLALYRGTGKNEYRVIVKKGTAVAEGLTGLIDVDLTMRIPSGAEIAAPSDVRAALSLLGGFIANETTNSAGLGDMLIQGTL